VVVHQLSQTDARRIAVRAQLLASPRPTDLVEVVEHLTLIQVDGTATVAPSAELVLWSRLGSAYSPVQLDAALFGRELVEYQSMIRPADDMALFRAEMDDRFAGTGLEGWEKAQAEWVRANDACRRDILDRLAAGAPLTARDIPDTCVRPWKSSGWNNNRNVTLLLEMMERRGEVAVAGHRGRDRLWDLASRIHPDDPPVPAPEALRIRNERRLRALGIARARTTKLPLEPADVGEVGEAAVIDGVPGQWRVDPAYLGQPFTPRAAVLSPLDRLVYDRKRMVELFGFDYQLEMYKPAAQRRWGYFALPILYGDRLIGKLDATADRKARVLRVDALHQDIAFDQETTEAVDQEIEDLAHWLHLALEMPG
jgi:uncharacterized protein